MRKLLLGIGVVLVCLPMAFVMLLLAAVLWPKMDTLTMRMPDAVRAGVAASVMDRVPFGKTERPGVHRVLALDPENRRAWSRLCQSDSDTASASGLTSCEKAVALNDTAMDWDHLGQVQERGGKPCDAADSYTKAASKGSSGTYYVYVENLGRASLRCGNLYDARAGLAAAIDLEQKSIKDASADDDDIADEKADLLADREYMIVTLDRLHNAAGAKEVCTAAHPDWKGCDCKLDDKGSAVCSNTQR